MAVLVQQSAVASTTGTAVGASLGVASTVGNVLWLCHAGDKNTGALTLPTGWNITHAITSTSVSLYMAWKVSAGETSVAGTTAASSPSGGTSWLAEYSEAGTGAWVVLRTGSSPTDETNVLSVTVTASSAAMQAGHGLAAAAVDSNTFTGTTWGPAGWTARGTAPASSGRAGIFTADSAVASGAVASANATFTGTADQLSGALVVFGRQVTAQALSGALSLSGSGTAGWAGSARQAASGALTASGSGTLGLAGLAIFALRLSGSGTMTRGSVRVTTRGTLGRTGAGTLMLLGGAVLDQYVYEPTPPDEETREVRWRYIAQRVLTGEFLHWDLPIKRDELRWDLSGPGALRGTISPEVGQLIGLDGDLLLQEWGTAIYAEADGELRWGGLVLRSNFEGANWVVECAGFSTYPQGIPYTGPLFSKINYDPTLAFKAIWTHLQTQPDGDLGVVVETPTNVPVRLGTPAQAAYQEVLVGGLWQRKSDVDAAKIIPAASAALAVAMTTTSTVLTLKALGGWDRQKLPTTATIQSEQVTVTARSGLKLTVVRGAGGTTKATHAVGVLVKAPGTETREVAAVEAEPYELAWWDSPDCGQELDRLTTETPWDWVEEHWWAGERQVGHRVRVAYPRLGRRRTDLAFIGGANVTNVVALSRNGDTFANIVYAIGAGEGPASLRQEVATRDGRLRRPVVHPAKAVNSKGRLAALARDQLARRQMQVDLSSITVKDHPNARLGSWDVGDDVLVRAEVPWLGWVEVWCRITAYALEGEASATLTLARTDSFTYGSDA